MYIHVHVHVYTYASHLVKEPLSSNINKNREVIAEGQSRVCGCLFHQFHPSLQFVQRRTVGSSTGQSGTSSCLRGGRRYYYNHIVIHSMYKCSHTRHLTR